MGPQQNRRSEALSAQPQLDKRLRGGDPLAAGPADSKRRQEVDRWALFVAVIALGFTAYSFFRQHGLQQRLGAIEEDRGREEVASSLQADVGARFESYLLDTIPARENYQLVLNNTGQARAEEVTVELVGPIEGNAPHLEMRGHSFPIALDPGQEYTIADVVAMGAPPSVDVLLRWEDGTGSREKTLNLTLFGR